VLGLSQAWQIQKRSKDGRTLIQKEKSKMKRERKDGRILGNALLAMALGLGAANLQAQESRKVLSNSVPVYPEMAKRMRLTGTVKVQIVIGTDGRIKEKNFIGGHPVLVSAVEETLKNWKYAPASGETTTQLEFNFHP
jgi:TonB family protein